MGSQKYKKDIFILLNLPQNKRQFKKIKFMLGNKRGFKFILPFIKKSDFGISR